MTTETIRLSDYSLVGADAEAAVEKGLAEATWYTSPVPRKTMRELLVRRNGPAIRDTLLWFALLIGTGIAGFYLWGSWWAIIPFGLYGVLYGSSSDSRWHEASHGTAFRTNWMNNVLYEIASFMILRESTPWRWSHTRHHSDTIIVGRDPEIAVPRPPDIKGIFLNVFALKSAPATFRKMFLHTFGRLDPEEATYIPESEHGKIFRTARIYVAIYAAVIGLSIALGSLLPLMFIGLPSLYGAAMVSFFGLTQHAGLAENVLDHRLNCRTVYMNPIFRFLYWNMNYHLEHHMFPLVPYHALPRLHKVIRRDCPRPYRSTLEAYREIIPALFQQVKDPAYYVRRELPTPSPEARHNRSHLFISTTTGGKSDGWVEVCETSMLSRGDVLRFDCDDRTFAVYRTAEGAFYATDGVCTHGKTHLADGLLKGNQIECPKHNGRFDIRDGSPQRRPVCVGLKTYPVEIRAGKLHLSLDSADGYRTSDGEIGSKTRTKAYDAPKT